LGVATTAIASEQRRDEAFLEGVPKLGDRVESRFRDCSVVNVVSSRLDDLSVISSRKRRRESNKMSTPDRVL